MTLHYIPATIVFLAMHGLASGAAPRLVASCWLPFTSSSAPAVGDLNADGRPDIVVTSDHIGDVTRERNDAANVNTVTAFAWSGGRLAVLPGWPRRLRDAALGLALADLDMDGRDDVIASCAQDFADPVMEAAGFWLVSRLYVFRGDGAPMPGWFPATAGGLQGQIAGHAYAAPVVAGRAGGKVVVQSSQGVWQSGAFGRGGMRMWSSDGRLVAFTGMLGAYEVEQGFSMDGPPVLAELDGKPGLEMVAASNDGNLHAWRQDGGAVTGWLPAPGAKTRVASAVRSPAAAADLDRDGLDEILVGGQDGRLRCFAAGGSLRWEASAPGGLSALTSGVAAGRLRDGRTFIVQGDASGAVTAWDGNGRVLWSATTTPGMAVVAEAAVGDVDGDGDQDVVVGGTDGLVYAWDAATGRRLWVVPTCAAPTPDGQRLQGVFGAPALADLRGDGSLCVVVVTGGRYVVDVATRRWQGFGRLLVFDCGTAPGRARPDWPQYRCTAQRGGRLAVGDKRR